MSQPRRDAYNVRPDAEFAMGTILSHDFVLTILTGRPHTR
jgi:hypothetical protein